MISQRYEKHTFSLKENDHPKYIKDRILNVKDNQFAHNAFGLKDVTSRPLVNYLKGYREKYINPLIMYKG
jgi:hypothetical protein